MKIFEEDNAILKMLSEAVSEGLVIVDASQTIVSTNKAAEEMFGYIRKELIGQHLDILIPKNYHHSHHTYVEEFITDADKRKMGHGSNLYGLRKDGSIFPVEAGLNPFQIKTKVFVMALVVDITMRKEQEKRILDLNSDLEKRIRMRTKELEKTVDELECEIKKRTEAEKKIKQALKREKELNELKTKFLSMVSHEFKTPLSGILTSTILLGKYQLTEQQEKRDKHIRTISEKVHYLNNILNDFLSIERLDTGKENYKMTTFKLSKVINEVVYNANMLLKSGQNIYFPPEVDDYQITMDEKILELSLSNLVHNAIKYSPENTPIEIDFKKNNSYFTIHVKDYGIGIPLEAQKNIFGRYFRAENALHNQGTGIGLNIVQGHLKNLGGTISFKSEENKGSIFTLNLPINCTS